MTRSFLMGVAVTRCCCSNQPHRLLQQHPATATPNPTPQLQVRLLLRSERLLLRSERLLQHLARLLLLHPETATPTPTLQLLVRLLRHPMRQQQQHLLTAT